jgi:hypothetical protein
MPKGLSHRFATPHLKASITTLSYISPVAATRPGLGNERLDRGFSLI